MTTPLPAPEISTEHVSGTALAAREKVGSYELLLELASGGMAVVYLGRACDGRATAPLVAIKRPHRHLAREKNFLAMLLDEARLASAIDHDNVVRVRELAFHEGEPFIVMEYVEGVSLSDLRKDLAASERALDIKIALRIILDALAGLHAAHELTDAGGKHLGIIHRDISPHNVLVGTDGGSRVTDFGIAHAEDRVQETRTHEVKGKLAYLAPERIDKRRICTRQSDLFSMGIVLWECLAGRRLFRGDRAVDTLQEVMNAPIPRLRQIGRDVPEALDAVIARALSRDLDERFFTAAELSAALQEAAGKNGIGDKEQVRQLVEAMYGPRMTERYQKVREVLGEDEATSQLFEGAGLAKRAHGAMSIEGARLAAIQKYAPPAPSERYLFGHGQWETRDAPTKKTRWMLAGALAAGLSVGVIITLALVSRSHEPDKATAAPRASSSVAQVTTPWAPAPVELDPPPPSPVRHFIVELPFPAGEVVVDGTPHVLVPAATTPSLDVLVESGKRHHLVATLVDGTKQEADVQEEDDGNARVLGGGFHAATHTVAALPAPPPQPKRSWTAVSADKPGTVHNGFTKLK